jgi:hypothetical protein
VAAAIPAGRFFKWSAKVGLRGIVTYGMEEKFLSGLYNELIYNKKFDQ